MLRFVLWVTVLIGLFYVKILKCILKVCALERLAAVEANEITLLKPLKRLSGYS